MDLTSRESQVVSLMSKGKTYLQIAEDLGIGFETVKTYVSRVKKKTGYRSKVLIVLWAKEKGII